MSEPLGLESKAVRLVPYDERWPGLFDREASRIAAAIAAARLPTISLEHIGSTAVPGLTAKPILDIAAGYGTGTSPSVYIQVLDSLGYEHRGDGGVPGREFFRRGELRSHHLHLVERNGTHWLRYLRFRNALRNDPAVRDAYAALKQALALQYPGDRDAYLLGKMDFVERTLQASHTIP